MPRGVAHPAALRAQVIAEIATGEPIAQVARRFGISKQTAFDWWTDRTVRTDDARATDALKALIYGLTVDQIVALRAQLQAFSRPEWLAQQNAADAAELVGTGHDRLVRLLSGLRPAESALALPEPDPLEAANGSSDPGV